MKLNRKLTYSFNKEKTIIFEKNEVSTQKRKESEIIESNTLVFQKNAYLSENNPNSLIIEILGKEHLSVPSDTNNMNLSSIIESEIKYLEEKILHIDEELIYGLLSEGKHEELFIDYETKLKELRSFFD